MDSLGLWTRLQHGLQPAQGCRHRRRDWRAVDPARWWQAWDCTGSTWHLRKPVPTAPRFLRREKHFEPILRLRDQCHLAKSQRLPWRENVDVLIYQTNKTVRTFSAVLSFSINPHIILRDQTLRALLMILAALLLQFYPVPPLLFRSLWNKKKTQKVLVYQERYSLVL